MVSRYCLGGGAYSGRLEMLRISSFTARRLYMGVYEGGFSNDSAYLAAMSREWWV